MEGRPEHHVKEMASADVDVWRKKPLAAECLEAIPTAYIGPVSIANNRDDHALAVASGMTVTSLSGKDVGETLTPILDPSDTQTQVIYCLNSFQVPYIVIGVCCF